MKTFQGNPCKYGHEGERYVKGGGCVVCARTQANKRAAENPEEMRRNYVELCGRRPEYILWLNAKHRAVRNGREFSIIEEDINIPDTCPVFGTPMVSPSIDRFDNSKGYTKDNIRVICKEANRIKGSATIEQLEAILEYMKTGAPGGIRTPVKAALQATD